MTTDRTDERDLTEPTLALIAIAGAAPSAGTLTELVEVRGEVAFGLASLSDAARADVDALLARHASVLAKSGLLRAPMADLEVFLDRLGDHADHATTRAGMGGAEVDGEVTALWRGALAARDRIAIRIEGAPAGAGPTDADRDDLEYADDTLRALLDDLLGQAAFRATAPPRPDAFFWWTLRAGCDRREVARLALDRDEPDPDSHVAECDSCSRELAVLGPILEAFAALPEIDHEPLRLHLSWSELLASTTLEATPGELERIEGHLRECSPCAERARALDEWHPATDEGADVTRAVVARPRAQLGDSVFASLLRHLARVATKRSPDGSLTVALQAARARPQRADAQRVESHSAAALLNPTSNEHRITLLPEGSPTGLELRIAEAWSDDSFEASFVIVSATLENADTRVPGAPVASVSTTTTTGKIAASRQLRASATDLVFTLEGIDDVDVTLRFAGTTLTVRLRFQRNEAY